MKIIFIYGAPASGKLTTGRELAKITNYQFLHDHLIQEIPTAIHKHGTNEWYSLRYNLFLHVLEDCLKNKTNTIVTYCYKHPDDFVFIKKLINLINIYDGDIYFIRLYCEMHELEKRVTEDSRKTFSKSQSVEQLRNILELHNLNEKIPIEDYLEINNTNLSHDRVALMIKEHVGIKENL